MSQFPCPLCGVERQTLTADCVECGWSVSPPRTHRAVDVSPASPASLGILACSLLLTLVFATINTIGEGYPLLAQGGIFFILLAGLSQLPGLFVAHWHWKKKSTATLPMLCAAYLIAVTGFLAYLVYALNGRADSLNTAAHLHVIAFPILHCVVAIVIYVGCGIASALLAHSRSRQEADSPSEVHMAD